MERCAECFPCRLTNRKQAARTKIARFAGVGVSKNSKGIKEGNLWRQQHRKAKHSRCSWWALPRRARGSPTSQPQAASWPCLWDWSVWPFRRRDFSRSSHSKATGTTPKPIALKLAGIVSALVGWYVVLIGIHLVASVGGRLFTTIL